MNHEQLGLIWDLGLMPHGDDPNDFPFWSIEKPIRTHYNFPECKIWKLRKSPPGLRELIEATQNRFSPITKPPRRRWILPVYVRHCISELLPGGWRKPQLHL